MLTVGLTGDVGAGKSTLSKIWEGMGALIIDADRIAREMWDLPEVRVKAAARWGGGFFDGDQRAVYAAIAAKIFSNEDEYKFVSELLHPPTMAKIEDMVRKTSGWTVVEIPLLFEYGRPVWIDYVVYVSALLEERINRNSARGWDAREIERREARLMAREKKMTMSEYVLDNSGSFCEWGEKAEKLGRIFLEKERSANSQN